MKNWVLKFEKIFLYIFVFCVPFQTRVFLIRSGDFFNEWTNWYFYLTDALIFALLFFWVLRFKNNNQKDKKWRLKIIVVVFWLIGAASISLATNKLLSFYGFLKLTELVLLFFYLKNSFILFKKAKVFLVFLISSLLQAILGIAQFFSQKSLGLWWLGESPLAPDINGVAKIDFWGQKVIRAYGTLPHPNILGVFLMVAFLGLLVYIFKKGFKSWQIAPLGLLILGIFVSFSRLVIFASLISFIILIIWQFFKSKNKRRAVGIFLLVSFFVFVSISLLGQVAGQRLNPANILEGQAKDLRVYYLQIGWEIFKQHPWGVGVGSFVNQFIENFKTLPIQITPWMYQPVHNIFALIAVELGLVGLVVFLWFLSEVFRRILKYKDSLIKIGALLTFLSFLFLGLFDHYFWTLQQGQLLFWGVLGIMAGWKN